MQGYKSPVAEKIFLLNDVLGLQRHATGGTPSLIDVTGVPVFVNAV